MFELTDDDAKYIYMLLGAFNEPRRLDRLADNSGKDREQLEAAFKNVGINGTDIFNKLANKYGGCTDVMKKILEKHQEPETLLGYEIRVDYYTVKIGCHYFSIEELSTLIDRIERYGEELALFEIYLPDGDCLKAEDGTMYVNGESYDFQESITQARSILAKLHE